MGENRTALAPGTIRFHSHCLPPLAAGGYHLTATQTVSELEGSGKFSRSIEFDVTGPRFTLEPGDVYSVYPPKGQAGAFDGTLPHAVFTRRTLPWERQIAGTGVPWMALLLLSGNDIAGGRLPSVEVRTVRELCHPAADAGCRGPWLDPPLQEDDLKALCSTIDLPLALFRRIAPTLAEMSLLTHVREVNTGAKETRSLLADGWFSVVIANRLPDAGEQAGQPVQNLALLVSLEGLTDLLPAPAGAGTAPASESDETVRLAVLSSWRFSCERGASFKSAMDKLELRKLELPAPTAAGEPAKRVCRAFAMGYVPLNHDMRGGERTVSWYRGPLVPYHRGPDSNTKFRSNADACLRYSSSDAMFDVTYAAAYQIGRLMALKDRHFATAITRFRRACREATSAELRSGARAGVIGGGGAGDESRFRGAVRRLLGATTASPANGADATAPGDETTTASLPDAAADWLARALLLYRLPLSYILPEQRLLQPGEMRVFFVDPDWVTRMVDGACSVGRSSAGEEEADRRLRDDALRQTLRRALAVRSGPLSDATADDGEVWPISGLLLRSPVVEGWQGLEITATLAVAPHGRAAPLRIDRVAPDILLCLFRGAIGRVEIAQPPEGMHFGLAPEDDKSGNRSFAKTTLRAVRDTTEPEPGTPIPLEPPVKVVTGAGDDPHRAARVVDVASLANNLAKRLESTPPTPAQFGVQMVEAPGRAAFVIPAPTTGGVS